MVNYDLPWNPQRIEQRIGRCHRYGQKYDVVVVNFLNVNNEADCRVFDILEKKLKLFEGVFGASDEVLGAIESGVDFERRIAQIYQNCRTSYDIQREFDFIQEMFAHEIGENMRNARRKLLENFDAEVAERLNVYQEASSATIDKMQALLWALTRHELDGTGAFFDEENLTFQMFQSPEPRRTRQKAVRHKVGWRLLRTLRHHPPNRRKVDFPRPKPRLALPRYTF